MPHTQRKIRIDRTLGIITIVITLSIGLMFGLKLILGNSYVQRPAFVKIHVTTKDLTEEKKVVENLLNTKIDLSKATEDMITKFNEKKDELTKINTAEVSYEDLVTKRKAFELIIYDINLYNKASDDLKPKLKIENGVHYINDILLVNKKNPLPESYKPLENPTARNAILKLIEKMEEENLNISRNYIGYRDYESQKILYEEKFKLDGKKEADSIVERPGYSEHQSGLGFSLLSKSERLLGLLDADQEAIDWLQENADKYGFILRYPKDKEAITGYSYRPWRIRYVGETIAKEIKEKNLTLEEYLGVEGGEYTD